MQSKSRVGPTYKSRVGPTCLRVIEQIEFRRAEWPLEPDHICVIRAPVGGIAQRLVPHAVRTGRHVARRTRVARTPAATAERACVDWADAERPGCSCGVRGVVVVRDTLMVTREEVDGLRRQTDAAPVRPFKKDILAGASDSGGKEWARDTVGACGSGRGQHGAPGS